MNEIITRLDYNYNKDQLPEGHFRIQASSLSRFFTNTSEWFDEKLCDAPGFTGNTSSVLGTCVHFYSEDFIENGQVDTAEIEKYISKFENNPNVDTAYIRTQYSVMGENLLNWLSKQKVYSSEQFVSYEVLPGIHAGGSIDLLVELYDGTYEIVDFKTTGSLTAPKTISSAYRTQLITYASVLSKLGINATSGKIVYITHNQINRRGKPTAKNPNGATLKDAPSTITELRFEITPEIKENFINNTLTLIAESVLLFMSKPELRHIIGQHIKFKNLTKKFTLVDTEINPDEI